MNELVPEKRIIPKYRGYSNMLKAKNYEFKNHERPFDVYTDGRNEIRICDSCHILSINGKRVQTLNILRTLVNFLFDEVPNQ